MCDEGSKSFWVEKRSLGGGEIGTRVCRIPARGDTGAGDTRASCRMTVPVVGV